MSAAGKRIGILGGTFDPIHYGHLITAENALDGAGLDQILLVPTGCSYFKEDQKVTSAELRYEMACLAAQTNPAFQVSDIETRRPGNSYTAETLQELHRLRPEDELFYIVGADTLVLMSLWKDPQVIFDSCTVLVEAREDQVKAAGLRSEIERLQERFKARIQLLPARNIEISSTEIRTRIQEGRSVRYLIPESVSEFIRSHGLYRD